MADPERPRDDLEDRRQRFEDEGRRSIFSALWFRAILVVVVARRRGCRCRSVRPRADEPKPPAKRRRPSPGPAPRRRRHPHRSRRRRACRLRRRRRTPPAADKPATDAADPATGAARPRQGRARKAPATAKKPDSSTSAFAKEAVAPAVGESAGAERFGHRAGHTGSRWARSERRVRPSLRRAASELKYSVEESSRAARPDRGRRGRAQLRRRRGRPASKYDVYVTGGAPADINARLAPKGLDGRAVGRWRHREAEPAAARRGRAVQGSRRATGSRCRCGGPAAAPPPRARRPTARVASSGDSRLPGTRRPVRRSARPPRPRSASSSSVATRRSSRGVRRR